MVYADRKARGVCDTRIKKAEDDYATKHTAGDRCPRAADASNCDAKNRPSAISRRQGQEHYHKQILRQLRRVESSARERSPRWHYDIELDTVDIALWIEA
jgi:hypothetical protein